jgi:hypothetical protein
MKVSSGIERVRIRIENAVLLPRMLEPPPAAAPASATEAQSLPRHLSQTFATRLPIGFCGIAEGAPSEGGWPFGIATWLYLYRDCNGLSRSFGIAGHDRDGIGSLFAGNDWLLARLWPARQRGRWDAGAARETLICHQSRRYGFVHGDGFAPIAEPAELYRAHLAVSRLARRLLWRGADPWQVVDLARGWSATRGHGALSGEIVEQIVDAACARELGFGEQRRAG